MALPQLEQYRPKEQPQIFENLQQSYLTDLKDNVSCFKAINEAAPNRFGEKNLTGESPLQTLKRLIFINKRYLNALNIPQDISQKSLRKKSGKELIEIFEKQAKMIYSQFDNDSALFELLIPNSTLINLPEIRVTGFEFLLDADGQLADSTGILLKHIDSLRSDGFVVKRPNDLSWGPEEKNKLFLRQSMSLLNRQNYC